MLLLYVFECLSDFHNNIFITKTYVRIYFIAISEDAANILELLKNYVCNARLVEEVGSELTYLLPSDEDLLSDYAGLFDAIDSSKAELNIDKYGLSDTNLEEVM